MRDSLINEIEEHFMNSELDPHGMGLNGGESQDRLNELMANDEMENMQFDIRSGHRHVKGHMLLNELDEEDESVDGIEPEMRDSDDLGYMDHLLSLYSGV